MSQTALIVEDNPAASEHLHRLLSTHLPKIKIVAVAETVVAAAKLVRQHRPDLLLLDVELPDGTGFDLLDILGETVGPVIFTTAMEHYALRAFRYAALDYLLKPVAAPELLAAIKRLGASAPPAEQKAFLSSVARTPGLPERIVLPSQEKLSLVAVNDIVRCAADNNYTEVYLQSGQRELVSQPLKHYATLLADHGFLRIHQSHLVNPRYLTDYVRADGGYVRLQDGTRLPVSVRRRSHVLAYFQQ